MKKKIKAEIRKWIFISVPSALVISLLAFLVNSWINYKVEQIIKNSLNNLEKEVSIFREKGQKTSEVLEMIVAHSTEIPLLIIRIENDIAELKKTLHITDDGVEMKYVNSKVKKAYYDLWGELFSEVRGLYYPYRFKSEYVFSLALPRSTKDRFAEIFRISDELEKMEKEDGIKSSSELFGLQNLISAVASLKEYFDLNEKLRLDR